MDAVSNSLGVASLSCLAVLLPKRYSRKPKFGEFDAIHMLWIKTIISQGKTMIHFESTISLLRKLTKDVLLFCYCVIKDSLISLFLSYFINVCTIIRQNKGG